jgi:hypothetical protein
MMVANSGILSTLTTTANTEITDKVDSPHSGLFKALHRMTEGNYTVKDAHSSLGLVHTFSFSGGNPQVAITAGKGLFNNKYITISALTTHTITGGKPSSGTFYHWARYNSSGTISIVTGTSDGVVPALGTGYAPISLIRVLSTDTAGGDIAFQLFTTSKTENSLSIGYEASNIYTEAMNITASSGDVTFKNIVQDKDIIFNVNDGGVDTEVMRIDGATSVVGIGTNAPDATLHIKSSSGNNPQLKLENTSTTANDEPALLFDRSAGSGGSGAIADGDNIGQIIFRSRNDAGTPQSIDYAKILVEVNDMTDGSEDGKTIFYNYKAGASTEFMRFASSFMINAAGANIDFIVEGDSETHLLYTDAGNDRVGIGNDSPSCRLHVKYSGNGDGFILESTDTGATNAPDMVLYRNGGEDPSDDDELGVINFRGLNDHASNQDVDYAYISARTTDVSDGSEEGALKFGIITGGSQVTMARLAKPNVDTNATVYAGWHTRATVASVGAATYAPDIASSGIVILMTNASSIVTLPDVAAADIGVQYTIINTSGGTLSGKIQSADTSNTRFNGAGSYAAQDISDDKAKTFLCTGADNWQVIG